MSHNKIGHIRKPFFEMDFDLMHIINNTLKSILTKIPPLFLRCGCIPVTHMIIAHNRNAFTAQKSGKIVISFNIFHHSMCNLQNSPYLSVAGYPTNTIHSGSFVRRLKIKILFFNHSAPLPILFLYCHE